MVGRRLSAELRKKAGLDIKRHAKRLNVRVTFSKKYEASAEDGMPYGAAIGDNGIERVYGPPLTTALSYFIFMHELGHVAIGDMRDEVNEEGKAWAWAAKHADPAIMATMTDSAWAVVGRMFTSYVQHSATH